jgi:hypothetical protein
MTVTYGQLTVPCPADAAELVIAGRIGFWSSHLWGIPNCAGLINDHIYRHGQTAFFAFNTNQMLI